MGHKIEVMLYVSLLALAWIVSLIGLDTNPMKTCQQIHSYDVCFTSLYK